MSSMMTQPSTDGGVSAKAATSRCQVSRPQSMNGSMRRERSSIVFVGFAAHGTLARKIVDGAKSVDIFGEEYAVRAQIYTIGGFSAHAGQTELLAWHSGAGAPERTFLVHGEKESMTAFSRLLKNTQVEMPELHQEYQF